MANLVAMTYSMMTALALFAFVTSITPGPNNLMLMASGARFGFRLSLPHMFGISLGFGVLIFAVGMGLAAVLETVAWAEFALKMLAAGFLARLAWKLAHAGAPGQAGQRDRPMGLMHAALFQWINPKGWMMALTAIAVYAPEQSVQTILAVTLVFVLVNFPSVGVWTLIGGRIGRVLQDPARARLFNLAMAGLLLATLFPILTG